MYRYLIVIHIFLLSALACPTSFTQCQDKYFDAGVESNNTLIIPLSKTQSLLYSKQQPPFKILKSNPYLGLYILENQNNKFPYLFSLKESDTLAVISSPIVKTLSNSKPQIGLSQWSQALRRLPFGMINDTCCSLHGLSVEDGIIEKDYLEHFVSTKEFGYADAGFRLGLNNKKAIVTSIDPYMRDQKFLVGDEILYMDKKLVYSTSALMQKILFSKPNTMHHFRIKREGVNIPLKVTFDKRYGGGLLSDTYLERFSLFLDRELNFVATPTNSKIKIADKLVAINGEKVEDIMSVRESIMHSPENLTFLLERNGFQFFIKFRKNK